MKETTKAITKDNASNQMFSIVAATPSITITFYLYVFSPFSPYELMCAGETS